jgi:hypothetical protein
MEPKVLCVGGMGGEKAAHQTELYIKSRWRKTAQPNHLESVTVGVKHPVLFALADRADIITPLLARL